MRALFTIAIVAAMCAAASAAFECGNTVLNNPYTPNNCSAFDPCDAAFCTCAGAPMDRNPTTCLAGATANCTRIQACLRIFSGCVLSIASFSTSAEEDCRDAAMTINAALLLTSGGTFNGSTLQEGCEFRVCQILNASTCGVGVSEAVCARANTDATSTLSPTDGSQGSQAGGGGSASTGSASGSAGASGSSSNINGGGGGGSNGGSNGGNTTRAPNVDDNANAASATSVFVAASAAIAALAFAL